MTRFGWYGVDLDGTLAHYTGWVAADVIGEPIPAMVDRVKGWLAEDIEVRIFTARITGISTRDRAAAIIAIQNWCERHIGQALRVTCVKDLDMIVLYDDRCVAVEQNTGRLLSEPQPRFTP